MLAHSSLQGRCRIVCGVGFAVAALLLIVAIRPAAADIVLLDEYWAPEIMVNDVVAEEVDTRKTGDASQAKTGEFSAKLTNETGAPNVRFRSVARVKLDELPLGKSEASLWYRTDAWTGRWRMEIWAYRYGITDVPVRVMEAPLNGGGAEGALVADDQWHQARGLLRASEAYDKVPHNEYLTTYLWLAPEGGWNIKHRTFVDRVEVKVEGSSPAPEPARHVRPRPGAQLTGDGWIWWEGEDAVSSNLPTGGVFLPDTVQLQGKLSNGAWLQYHGNPDFTATWQVEVKEPGRYTLWYRGFETPFRWQWEGGDSHECGTDTKWVDSVQLWPSNGGALDASWANLGQVTLPAGKQTLVVKALPASEVIGTDCWLLTSKPFAPSGVAKPRN